MPQQEEVEEDTVVVTIDQCLAQVRETWQNEEQAVRDRAATQIAAKRAEFERNVTELREMLAKELLAIETDSQRSIETVRTRWREALDTLKPKPPVKKETRWFPALW